MPIYDYVCSRCSHRIEVVHGIHARGPKTCRACGAEGAMTKAIVPPAIHFKGSGWAKKDRSATATPGSSRSSTSPATPTTDASPAGPALAGGEGASAKTPTSASDGAPDSKKD